MNNEKIYELTEKFFNNNMNKELKVIDPISGEEQGVGVIIKEEKKPFWVFKFENEKIDIVDTIYEDIRKFLNDIARNDRNLSNADLSDLIISNVEYIKGTAIRFQYGVKMISKEKENEYFRQAVGHIAWIKTLKYSQETYTLSNVGVM